MSPVLYYAPILEGIPTTVGGCSVGLVVFASGFMQLFVWSPESGDVGFGLLGLQSPSMQTREFNTCRIVTIVIVGISGTKLVIGLDVIEQLFLLALF